jgi:hypothetical protein
MGEPPGTREEERWRTVILCRLSSIEQCHKTRRIPSSKNRRYSRLAVRGHLLHHSRFSLGLLASANGEVLTRQHTLRTLQVQEDGLRFGKCTGNLSKVNGSCTNWTGSWGMSCLPR